MNWNVEKVQQGKNVLSNTIGFSEEVNSVFQLKMFQIDTENGKKYIYFFNFQGFYAFFVKVSTDFVDWNVLKVQQGKVGCPVVFHEEINAMF